MFLPLKAPIRGPSARNLAACTALLASACAHAPAEQFAPSDVWPGVSSGTAVAPAATLASTDAAGAAAVAVAGPCSLLEAADATSPAAMTDLEPGSSLWQAKGKGTCQVGPHDLRFLMVVDRAHPRLLGHPMVLIVHAGDQVILRGGEPAPNTWLSADASQTWRWLKPLESLDPGLKPLKGRLAPRNQPLSELKAQSRGVLSALGTFDHVDARPADGADTLKVLLRAEEAGDLEFSAQQPFDRDGGASGQASSGVYAQTHKLNIRPAAQPVVATFGELTFHRSEVASPDPARLDLGVGDLAVYSVSLGFLSRLGSETRGPIGFSELAVEPRGEPE